MFFSRRLLLLAPRSSSSSSAAAAAAVITRRVPPLLFLSGLRPYITIPLARLSPSMVSCRLVSWRAPLGTYVSCYDVLYDVSATGVSLPDGPHAVQRYEIECCDEGYLAVIFEGEEEHDRDDDASDDAASSADESPEPEPESCALPNPTMTMTSPSSVGSNKNKTTTPPPLTTIFKGGECIGLLAETLDECTLLRERYLEYKRRDIVEEEAKTRTPKKTSPSRPSPSKEEEEEDHVKEDSRQERFLDSLTRTRTTTTPSTSSSSSSTYEETTTKTTTTTAAATTAATKVMHWHAYLMDVDKGSEDDKSKCGCY